MNPASVFDHTALIALFNADPSLLSLWQEADRGERPLVMPAAAVAEANHALGASHNAWSVLLYPAQPLAGTLGPVGRSCS
jgi:hypothetical protein